MQLAWLSVYKDMVGAYIFKIFHVGMHRRWKIFQLAYISCPYPLILTILGLLFAILAGRLLFATLLTATAPVSMCGLVIGGRHNGIFREILETARIPQTPALAQEFGPGIV